MFERFMWWRTPIEPVRGGFSPWENRQKPARAGWGGILTIGFIMVMILWLASLYITFVHGQNSIQMGSVVEVLPTETESVDETETPTETPTIEITSTPTQQLVVQTSTVTLIPEEPTVTITIIAPVTWTPYPTYTPYPTLTPHVVIVTPNQPAVQPTIIRSTTGSGAWVVPDQRGQQQQQPQYSYQQPQYQYQQPQYIYPTAQFVIPPWESYITSTPIPTPTARVVITDFPVIDPATFTPNPTETSTNEPTQTLTSIPATATIEPTYTPIPPTPTDEPVSTAIPTETLMPIATHTSTPTATLDPSPTPNEETE